MLAIGPVFVKTDGITITMLFNYLKIALRILTRNKMVSVINICGFALALTGCILIAIFIHDEVSYDRYHKNADRIFRITRNYVTPEGGVHMHLGHLAAPFAPLLKNDFPDIIETARTLGPFNPAMTLEEGRDHKSIEFKNGYVADPSVFTIFSIPVLSGNRIQSLQKPNTMMLSDEAARKHFGHTDVIGRKLKLDDLIIEITGTYKAFPKQSHWHADFLLSFSTLYNDPGYGKEKLENGWENNSFLTYILVNSDFNSIKTQQQLPGFIDKHMPSGDNSRKQSASTNLFLQPLTSIHLHSHLDSEAETNGNINHIYVMGSIGIFLITIACFNFINLSTARATTRAKEVGLRKVSGAQRMHLILQYISESMLIALLALVIASAIASACLPWLNDFTGKSITPNDYLDIRFISGAFVLVAIVGIAAGIYPAFIISGYKPAQVLKGQSGSITKGSGIRKALVVVQFSISIVMIIATLITYQQLDFVNKKDLGYNKDQVVVFRYPDEIRDHYDAFFQALTQQPSIENATRTNRMPTVRLLETNYVKPIENPGDKKTIMKNVSIDQHFFETYNIQLVAGKNFSKNISKDDTFEEKVSNGFILNETAASLLGWTAEEAVGKEITNGDIPEKIIGVVKDFHFESLHERIAPIVFITYPDYRQVSALVSGTDMKASLLQIEKVWKQFVTDEPFEYEFINERYAKLYESESRQQELFIVFAVLAIFIASLGLFGLVAFNSIQRRKEVSIRKILGASVHSILHLLSKEIIVLVVIANAIAWPFAWYFMNEWLQEFTYHIEMSVMVFIGSGLLTLCVTLITITTQTLKTALTNPATILRNE